MANVRRYKGSPASPKASPSKTIRIQDGFAKWRDVLPEFRDHAGEMIPRDFAGVAGQHYTNRSGRNDLVTSKVARDGKNLYFQVRTRESITPSTGSNWMWLLIDADQDPATGWAGYDFIVNRALGAKGESWLEKNTGGWNWKRVSHVNLRVEGNELQLAILQLPGDIMDFYVNGDAAPESRFNYRYSGE